MSLLHAVGGVDTNICKISLKRIEQHKSRMGESKTNQRLFREEKWLASFNFIELGRMQQSWQHTKRKKSLQQWMAKAPWKQRQSQSDNVHAVVSMVIQRKITQSPSTSSQHLAQVSANTMNMK
jgi:hypothetical protein